MTDIWPVRIPSKGRPDGRTMQLLRECGIPYVVYVEPSELEAYNDAGHDIRVLNRNNKGLAYSRQFIYDDQYRAHAVDGGPVWYWTLDDDLTAFYTVDPFVKKCIPCDIREALTQAQTYLKQAGGDNLAQGAIEYRQFAWSQSRPYKYNSYCNAAVAINVYRTSHVKYRPDLKEDIDFTLQCLSTGYNVCRVTHVAFSTPSLGTNAGGLDYSEEQIWSDKMARLWPGIAIPFTRKDGRPDVKINWRHFA